MAITEKQKACLASLKSGPDLIPVIHFGALSKLGYVEKVDNLDARARGFAPAKLTAAGLAEL